MKIYDIKNYWKRYGFKFHQVARVGADNLSAYFWDKKSSLGPLYIGWNLTFKCNCFCSFCKTHEFVEKKQELDTDECLRIVRELGRAKIVELSLTGGEPLLRHDIGDIIREAKKSKINVNIITNGALLERHAQMIVDAGVDSVSISLDSLIPEEHNAIRRHKDLYQKVELGVQKLNIIKCKKNKKPRIIIGSTINKRNYRNLESFIEHWKKLSDQVVFQPIHTGAPTSLFKVSDKALEFDRGDKEEFINFFRVILKKYPWLNNSYEREFSSFFFEPNALYDKYKCSAGFFMLQIDAYGNVYPCTENIWNIGNLRDESFMDLWQGKKLSKVRQFIREGKNKCFCWHRCTGPLNCILQTFIKGRKGK